jgi:hypothetical protein
MAYPKRHSGWTGDEGRSKAVPWVKGGEQRTQIKRAARTGGIVGAGAGSMIGLAVGARHGHPIKGAAIGALTGATGGAIGRGYSRAKWEAAKDVTGIRGKHPTVGRIGRGYTKLHRATDIAAGVGMGGLTVAALAHKKTRRLLRSIAKH